MEHTTRAGSPHARFVPGATQAHRQPKDKKGVVIVQPRLSGPGDLKPRDFEGRRLSGCRLLKPSDFGPRAFKPRAIWRSAHFGPPRK